MRKPKRRPKISLLIPFRSHDPERIAVFKWLIDYWQNELPEAELVIGSSQSYVFSKTEALNDAASRASGRVLVILDADAYISGEIINRCADQILENLDDHLWFVPYRNLYRLNKTQTFKIIESDPANPYREPDPPPERDLDGEPETAKYGRAYAALTYIIPREALDVIGCWDERFKGWGGEDISTLRALDTLYGKHKTTNNGIFHLWHPKIGDTYVTRVWEGQTRILPNQKMALAYSKASGDVRTMRELVESGCEYRKRHYGQGVIWQGLEDWVLEIIFRIRKTFLKTKWWD